MNKKLISISLLAVLMLVTISLSTAVSTEVATRTKESPLYGMRIQREIGKRISGILENIQTKFLGERIFFLPFVHKDDGLTGVRLDNGDKWAYKNLNGQRTIDWGLWTCQWNNCYTWQYNC